MPSEAKERHVKLSEVQFSEAIINTSYQKLSFGSGDYPLKPGTLQLSEAKKIQAKQSKAHISEAK